jgi:23S rRNA pseudouridine1911/1915/1917 synthase
VNGVSQFVVRRAESGQTLLECLRSRLALSQADAVRMIEAGRVAVAGTIRTSPQWRIGGGQRIEIKSPSGPSRQQRRASRLDPSVIVHEDDHIVVVDKPAGLTTMRHPEEAAEFGSRGQRFLPETVADLLPPLLSGRDRRVIPVHRLDKETSGLVVFARNPDTARHLGRLFREHRVERRYLALVRGLAISGRIESRLVRDRGDGRRGSSSNPALGERAVTHVEVVKTLGDFTLVECRLETGRTHQVRIHLGEAGTPLCGERIYDRPLHGRPLPDESGASRILLHAASLGFTHPATLTLMSWTSLVPEDMEVLIKKRP